VSAPHRESVPIDAALLLGTGLVLFCILPFALAGLLLQALEWRSSRRAARRSQPLPLATTPSGPNR
jgi:hypothetical protein